MKFQSRKPKYFNIDEKLTFGKYKGYTLRSVIESERNPEYLLWCLENIEWFFVDDETEIIIGEATEYWNDWKLDMEGHRQDIY